MNFSEYARRGLVKKQTPDFRQIENQISRAERDLVTFGVVIGSDPEWAATIAYHAMLRAGRALIFAHGYLPADGQQHKTVVEITGEILGAHYSTTVKQFDVFRRKRNSFFYDSQDSGNTAEAKKAAEVAAKLILAIRDEVSRRDPQTVLGTPPG